MTTLELAGEIGERSWKVKLRNIHKGPMDKDKEGGEDWMWEVEVR